jgi:hypothetical protein
LSDNKLTTIPKEILNIKGYLNIDETSYNINNLNFNTEFLILTIAKTKINRLPVN